MRRRTPRRNRAVQDLYEPGSTFKLVTASAAIEEKVVTPDEIIDVSAGIIRFGNRVIDDMHRYGPLSFTDVIVKSSNVGAIKVGLKLGAERMGLYVRRFGFGRPTSPDFPGESPGIVWEPSKLNDSALASVSMGYQVGVTPLQMAAAASVIANGGTLFEPHVVRAIVKGGHAHVRRAEAGAPRDSGRDRGDAHRHHGEGRDATAPRKGARLVSYDVAGKTGTADKLVNGRYSPYQQNVSFVGFVPSRNPALTVIVMVDSPRVGGDTGGAIAAPIFKRIADASLRQLGVTPTINPAPPVIVARNQPAPVTPAAAVGTPNVVAIPASMTETGLPDLRGMSAREALRELARLGLTARMQGIGVVVDQSPAAGSPLEPGAHVHARPQSPRRVAAGRSQWRSAVTLGDMVDALRDLAVDAPSAGLKANASISAIAYDSRRVVPGSVFVALKGLRADGGAFAEQAAQRGAHGDRLGIGAAGFDRRFRGSPSAMRDWRWRCSPIVSSITRAAACRSSVSPARTARRRPPICWRPSSTRPAFAPACSAPSRIASAARTAKPRAPHRKLPTCSSC